MWITWSKKADRNLEFVMRNLKGTGKKVKARAYETLVRPMLEYRSKVSDSYRLGQKKQPRDDTEKGSPQGIKSIPQIQSIRN